MPNCLNIFLRFAQSLYMFWFPPKQKQLIRFATPAEAWKPPIPAEARKEHSWAVRKGEGTLTQSDPKSSGTHQIEGG